VLATDYFLDALGDPEIGLKIREKNPKNLDAALRIALQLEVWTKDSYRLQQAETPRPADRRNREITKPGQPSGMEKRNEALQKEITEAKKTIEDIRKIGAKIKQELQETRKKVAEMEGRTARPLPVMYAGNAAGNMREPPRCFRCEELGHFIRNCPNFLPGTAPRTYALNNRPGLPSETRPVAEKKRWTCITAAYNRHTITAFLNTGSDVTIAGLSLVKKHKWKIYPYHITALLTATGADMVIDGIAKVLFEIGTQTLDTTVLISPDMTGLILGIDWRQNQKCLFDCAGHKVQVHGEWIPLQREPVTTNVRRIYVSKNVEFPPMQQTPVNARVSSGKLAEDV